LERSGVGSANLLKQLDVKVVSDLPGVGCVHNEHLLKIALTLDTARNTKITTQLCQVSPQSTRSRCTVECVILVYRVSNESTTLDDFLRGDEQAQKEVSLMTMQTIVQALKELDIRRVGGEP
jgi:alcohol oxidase